MRVLILDSNATVRETLRNLFESESDFVVAAGAGVGAVAAIDVVVADEHIAGARSPAAQRTLAALSKRAPVVVIGMGERLSDEDAHVAAGAVGYWPKNGDIARLAALARAAGLVARADRACAAAAKDACKPRFADRRTVAVV
jgi:DNA-binding NarL/FixJ family response regulator